MQFLVEFFGSLVVASVGNKFEIQHLSELSEEKNIDNIEMKTLWVGRMPLVWES